MKFIIEFSLFILALCVFIVALDAIINNTVYW